MWHKNPIFMRLKSFGIFTHRIISKCTKKSNEKFNFLWKYCLIQIKYQENWENFRFFHQQYFDKLFPFLHIGIFAGTMHFMHAMRSIFPSIEQTSTDRNPMHRQILIHFCFPSYHQQFNADRCYLRNKRWKRKNIRFKYHANLENLHF